MRPELSKQQRVVKLVWLMADGGEYSTSEVADMFGISYSTARRLMIRLQVVIPLASPNELGGKWVLNLNSTAV